MAQHILITNEAVRKEVITILKNKCSMKGNVVEELNPKARIDLNWLKDLGLEIQPEELETAKGYYVELFKPLTKLRQLLGEEFNSFNFEVFKFGVQYIVFWVA